jgi:hypothetical protein
MRKYNAENTTGEVAVGLSTIESTVHAAAATDRVTECIDLLARHHHGRGQARNDGELDYKRNRQAKSDSANGMIATG